MPELVGVLDTGVLCCLLEIPGLETASSGPSSWTSARANTEIDRVIRRSGTLILPLSVIVETANHIANAKHSRRTKATQLFDRVVASLEGIHPWKQFSEPERLWTVDWYKRAREHWPDFADRRMGLADYSIADISKYFHALGSEVITLTTDLALATEVGHLVPEPSPRSRRRR